VVTAGTYAARIGDELQTYAGTHYKAYCVCLAEGGSLVVSLGLLDYALHLFDPTGEELAASGVPFPPGVSVPIEAASIDLAPVPRAGLYMILVRGVTWATTGTVLLDVRIE